MSSRPSRGAARLAAILDALPDGLVLVNCNGTVVNANTIALEMFETPGTALVGRGLLDLLPAFDSRLIPGSMRRPEAADARGRTKPARMIARRTDGGEFPVEVTSASLEDGREAYAPQGAPAPTFTGDELLMLVVRDLSGTLDTEAELARSQRQTEMILRAAAEGVVGTDTDGRVVLVNPAAAQILGWRAGELGGKELHTLMLHSRADGEPFPYDESPLADTLRSGRKHRVRNQVVWAKDGSAVPVDLTTAPVRDGDQLVGAVMTFTDRRPYEEQAARHEAELTELTEAHETALAELTGKHEAELAALTEKHATELADRSERSAVTLERLQERYDEAERHQTELTARHAQLTAVLAGSLRGPLERLRAQLGTLAADPAGQLWPEANQVLHHLSAGYARMTTLVDNVLAYQRLDAGAEELHKDKALLDAVVAAGVEGAVELIGPGRVQFAVHAPPIEAEVDGARLSVALAHLIADVAGVDSTGTARAVPGGGYADTTVVVAAAQRGEVVRIEVRGPYAGGDPVHEPVVRGIVTAHGGVVQAHEVPGAGAGAYVLEVPLGGGSGAVAPGAPVPASGAAPADGDTTGVPHTVKAEAREAAGSPGGAPDTAPAATPAGPVVATPAGVPGGPVTAPAGPAGPVVTPAGPAGTPVVPAQASPGSGTAGGGRRRARRASTDAFLDSPVRAEDPVAAEPTGRRRARPEPAGAPAGAPAGTEGAATEPTGRRRGRPSPAETAAPGSGAAPGAGGEVAAEGAVLTAAESAQGRAALGETVPPQGMPADAGPVPVPPAGRRARREGEPLPALPAGPALPPGGAETPAPGTAEAPGGRRARRALAAAHERDQAPVAPEGAARSPFALPPAAADRRPDEAARHDAAGTAPDDDHTPPQPHPLPSGRRRAPAPVPGQPGAGAPDTAPATGPEAAPTSAGTGSVPLPPTAPPPAGPAASGTQPLPVEAPADSTQGREFSVRTLGQGVPFVHPGTGRPVAAPGAPAPQPTTPQPAAPHPGQGTPPHGTPAHGTPAQGTPAQAATPPTGTPPAAGTPPQGSGRRRKLATPPEDEPATAPQPAPAPARPGAARPQPGAGAQPPAAERPRLAPRPGGRAYEIGAPDENADEGPEPLDGPGGAVEVANEPVPQPVDDELPPEPLDNPRRLLVWPAPDVSTQQALSDRGYRPVIVHSREEVDAQIAAFPAALFVDPLTGPITRTALQSLRQAAVAAEVPVLLAAGLGQATREAAYGADPAVLLKALAPRDSEQHPSRVLLIEEQEEIALALTAALERRGMRVAHAATDGDAVTLAAQIRPNLVVMDLMQIRRRRAGIIDWLRANGQLNRTPLVVYTAASLDRTELPRLASGETVLFLAERSTSAEVQSRIVDLLAKIGTN
ncbi:PAS domain-containing protein [Streptomyces sp. LP05-1]|uniref:histidine kinase n=1 Tax=Streptomyces pyxinae TaxID=2970734 RepID=A0ABT2CCJ0_9ACTN|nr:PAS domain-containing protein [Streptomyces sp. LP05-1]MCS0635113.1 PAS domain-containing protein [Streptomyces sp. LP05-1]